MEWYHLLITDVLSQEEEHFLSNYFEAANISPDDTNNEILPCNFYLAVLNFKKHEEWKKLSSFQYAIQLISNYCEDLANDVACNSSLTADCINNLADNLPLPGSFALDVIVGHNIFQTFSVSENAEFALALNRLSEWHSARITFMTHREADDPLLDEWLTITKAEMVNPDNQIDASFPFWRGSIEWKGQTKPSQNFKGLDLRMLSKNKGMCHNLKSLFNISNSPEHLFHHPILQAVDMCSFSSIPHHLILPVAFKLCISSNIFYSDSSKLFANVRAIRGAALIVRMRYSVSTENSKTNKLLSTSKWLRVVSSGNVKYPENGLPDCDSFLTLAIVPSTNCDEMLAFAIQNPSNLRAQFHFGAVNLWNKQALYKNIKAATKTKNEEKRDFSVPFIPAESFQSLLSECIASGSADRLENATNSDSASHNASNGKDLLSSFIQAVNYSEHLKLHRTQIGDITEEIDPSDWPERIHLLQRQIQFAEETENKKSVFMTFSPQRSLYNVSFSGDDIKKYFDPSGKAKDNEMKETIRSELNYRMKSSLEEVIKTQWPAILNCTFDDIYYNASKQSEEMESVGNEMVKCYVQHETASTCNNHQSQPDAPITVHASFMTPRKRPKSRSKAETSFRQDITKPNTRVNETFLKSAQGQSNPVISTIMKTLGVTEAAKATKHFSRKNSQPVRCSPRKKPAVNYFSSSRDRNLKKATQKDKNQSNKFTELMKKKLRDAVASALESNGIDMNDAFFRPCFKKLFTICQTFVEDIPQKGSTSQHMQRIANAHVLQVIKFEKQKAKEK